MFVTIIHFSPAVNRRVSPDSAATIKRAAEALLRAKGEGSEPSLSRSNSMNSSYSTNEDGIASSNAGPTNKRKRQWIELADYQQQQQQFAAFPSPSDASLQSRYVGGIGGSSFGQFMPPLQSSTPPVDRPSILSRLGHSGSGGQKGKTSPSSGDSGGLLLADGTLSTNDHQWPISQQHRKGMSIRTASPNTLYIASALSLLCGRDLSPKSLSSDSPCNSASSNSSSPTTMPSTPATAAATAALACASISKPGRHSPDGVTQEALAAGDAQVDPAAVNPRQDHPRSQSTASRSSMDNTSEEDGSDSPFKLISHRSLHRDTHDEILPTKSDISCLFPNSIHHSPPPTATGSRVSAASPSVASPANWTKPVVDLYSVGASGAKSQPLNY
jgi:hypothetical protein